MSRPVSRVSWILCATTIATSTFLDCGERSNLSAAAPPRVEFHQVRHLPHHRLFWNESWSFTDSLLVLSDNSGVCVFDCRSPESGPLRLPVTSASTAFWSHHGDRLAFVAPYHDRAQRYGITIVDPAGHLLLSRVHVGRLWPVWWGADGNLYAYTESDSGVITLSDGAARARTGEELSALVMVGGGFMRHVPGHEPKSVLPSDFRGSDAFVCQAWPEMDRYLVRGLGVGDASQWIVDAAGHRVADLDSVLSGYSPTGLSRDGDLVIGNTEESDGHVLFAAKLFVTSRSGHWTAPIHGTGDGMGANFAAFGTWIAYQDPVNGGVYVGWLSIER